MDAGADLIFTEALATEADFEKFRAAVDTPLLANMTEFGRTVRVNGTRGTDHGTGTVAFVLGGAIIPMAIAWRVAARRRVSVLGTPFPPLNRSGADAKLVVGSTLFGAGWALAGLCPGPALASAGFGGAGGAVFLIAMLAAMVAAPRASRLLDTMTAPKGTTMDIRALTPTYAVSPQITPEDLPAIKANHAARMAAIGGGAQHGNADAVLRQQVQHGGDVGQMGQVGKGQHPVGQQAGGH